jgi:hypothetical protein
VGVTAGVALGAIVLSMSSARSVLAENIKATGDDGTKELFSETVSMQFGTNAGVCDANNPVVVVPQGKRLVVEFMSVTAEMVGTDDAILVNIRPASGPNHILASVVPVFGGTTPNGLRWFGISQPVKLYFDQGEDFMFCAFKSGTNDAAFFQATASGYFVNRPQ